jgi:hypothetical protein
MSQTAKQRALTMNRVQAYRDRDKNVTTVALQCHDSTETEKSSQYVSTVVSHDKDVSREEVKEKGNDLMKRIFERPVSAGPTKEAGWVFAWAAVAGVLSDSDVESILESLRRPGIQQRGRYLRKCVINRLEIRGWTWDQAMASARKTK